MLAKADTFVVNPFNMNCRSPLFTVIIILSISACKAQSVSKGSLLALSKTDHTLAIVDPTTLNVTGKVPVGIDPHEVVASTDGKTAYVTIYGGGTLH